MQWTSLTRFMKWFMDPPVSLLWDHWNRWHASFLDSLWHHWTALKKTEHTDIYFYTSRMWEYIVTQKSLIAIGCYERVSSRSIFISIRRIMAILGSGVFPSINIYFLQTFQELILKTDENLIFVVGNNVLMVLLNH